MKVLICGGRNFNNYDALLTTIDKNIDISSISEIVSGHCEGADKLGERFAREFNITCKVFPANWKKYGKAAGIIRNNDMLSYISSFDNSIVIACVSKNSKGTKYTLEKAKKLGLKTIEIYYDIEDIDLPMYEGISMKDGKFDFDWNQDSPDDIVKLTKENIHSTKYLGNIRYYGYKVNASPSIKKDKEKFLKWIKLQDTLDNIEFQELLNRCIEDFYTESVVKHYDYIVKPVSSSSLNTELVDKIKEYFDPDTKVLTVSKKPIEYLEIDWDVFNKKVKAEYKENFSKFLTTLIDKIKNNHTNFSISNIKPQYRQFIKTMYEFSGDEKISFKPTDNILIVDDTFTTGSSINMLLQLFDNTVNSISIFTLIDNR